jgi:hypothetical protein
MIELPLGFDARVAYPDPRVVWPDERRQTFLFKVDAKMPLSVDEAIWPSIFDDEAKVSSYFTKGGGLNLQPRLGLWRNLDELRLKCRSFTSSPESYCLLAISIATPEPASLPDHIQEASRIFKSTDLTAWDSLGFDVADSDLLSGLMNCGFDEAELTTVALEARALWSRELNEYSLFDNYEAADAFRAYSDERVPEHAPFYVFRLLIAPGNTILPAIYIQRLANTA